MLSYIARRVLLMLPVIFGVTLIVFALVALAPGDVISLMLSSAALDPANAERLRRDLGLDLPWYQQYTHYMGNLLRGDLGRSIMFHRPVLEQIRDSFPNTLLLTLAAMVFALLVSIPAGVISAARRNTAADYVAMIAAMAGVSMPSFWLGLLLMLFFGLRLGWLPIGGMGSLDNGLWDVIRHLILPAIALGSALAAILTRLTRNALLDVLAEDYVRTARAKGVADRGVLYKHALRNAILPVVTTAGLQFGALLGGTVIIETIFSWPGMGLLAVTAIKQRDFPVIQGTTLLFAACFVVVMLLTDLVYGLINPRIRYV